MELSHELLADLSEIGVFQPSNLNDAYRVDHSLDDRPFLAVDREKVVDCEDALKVSKNAQGFLVETALADIGQLSDRADLIEEAIKRKRYRLVKNVSQNILDTNVARQLRFVNGVNRAIVIRQQFTKEFKLDIQPEIYPASVRVERMSTQSFAWQSLHDAIWENGDLAPFYAFYSGFWEERKAHYQRVFNIKSARDVRAYSSDVVAFHMNIANIAIAGWANTETVPIIYRGMPENKSPSQPNTQEKTSSAIYTDAPIKHYGIRGHEAGVLYTQASAPLQHPLALLTGIQLSHALAGKKTPFTRNQIATIVEQFNPQALHLAAEYT